MISRSARLALSLTIAMFAVPGRTPAADVSTGEKLAYTCHGCHGIPRLQERVPGLQRAKARWPARRLPRCRAQGLCERGTAARDDARTGRLVVGPGHAGGSAVPLGPGDREGTSGRYGAKGRADVHRLSRHRWDRHHARVPKPDRPAPGLHRTSAQGVPLGPAQERRHGRHGGARSRTRTSTRSRSTTAASSRACVRPTKCAKTVIVRRRERLTRRPSWIATPTSSTPVKASM